MNAPSAKLVKVLGQPSWRVAASQVEAHVTRMGGHVAPVIFDRGGRRFAPYAVAPWAEEKTDPSIPPILKALRGDFFCMPFGGNETPWKDEHHPAHGETANALWHFESLKSAQGQSTLHLSLQATVRPGRVDKRVRLKDGQNAIYLEDIISEMKGPMSPGHHAILRFPNAPASGVVSTSPFLFGQVLPTPFENPAQRGYSYLKPGATFTSLSSVPALMEQTTDLSHYPARRGFEDLVMMVSDPALPFAWTAVTFPKMRAVWFSLKDPRILRETVLWLSNGGRHYEPWNGRHINVMGLEEVTSYFHYGLAGSVAKNPLSEKGYVTHLVLDPRNPLRIPYIMVMTAVPPGFDRVAEIMAAPDQHQVTLVSASGKRAKVPVNVDFLSGMTE
jgi:hypothetical protein